MQTQKIEDTLRDGVKDRWYPICPTTFITDKPVSLRRLGRKLVLWRDSAGTLYCLNDRCPHRGAPLSQGIILGDTLACVYHGVEVRADGVATRVPGSPGCKLEGSRSTESFHVKEIQGYVFIYNHSKPVEVPPALNLPEQLLSPEYEVFPCYAEWKTDYRMVQDNVMDPMHGTFLHKQTHAMHQGDTKAKFRIRDTADGFIFEKADQQNMNFDWAEFGDTGFFWQRLSIPYAKAAGPGGHFFIVGSFTPISPTLTAVCHWRCRQVQGWQRNAWKFLFKTHLELRHWAVLEQDRNLLESAEPDAREHEILYEHDVGLVRLRRHMRQLATQQLQEIET